MKTRSVSTKETVMQWVFTVCACVSILAVALICLFLFANGVPTIAEIGPLQFLLGTNWKPGNDLYGILPMILGSIYVTAGAIVVGRARRPADRRLHEPGLLRTRSTRVLLPAVQLLAGIPFGRVRLLRHGRAGACHPGGAHKTDFVRKVIGINNGKGMSLFTASLLLGIMILPTIITVSKTSLDAVPESYYEGSLALGATHERSVFFTVLPAAKFRRYVRRDPGHRARHRRDDGRRHGRGQPDLECRRACSRACAP